jgi:hypothetical protein
VRKVCSVAPAVLAPGKGKPRSGWILAGAKVVGGAGGTGGTYTKNVAGAVAQVATHFLPDSCASAEDASNSVPAVARQNKQGRRVRLEERVIAIGRCILYSN